MKKLLLLTSLVLMFIFVSCSSNSEEDLLGDSDTNITYNNTISIIVSGNCFNCHGSTPANGAPMSLSTYTNVKDAVTGRGLIGRIESGSMPQNAAKLSAANIQAFKDWQTNGFPQ